MNGLQTLTNLFGTSFIEIDTQYKKQCSFSEKVKKLAKGLGELKEAVQEANNVPLYCDKTRKEKC
jgi:hypothetical protein